MYWEYDTRTARRWNLDPKPRIGISDYSVMDGNPILSNDPNGDCPNCVTAAIGAVAGGLIMGGIELGGQLMAGKSLDEVDWVDVGVESGKGIVEGAMVGSGAGLVALASAEAYGTYGGNAVKATFDYSSKDGNVNVVNGKKTIGSAVVDYTVDVAGGKLLDKAGSYIKKVSSKGISQSEKLLSTTQKQLKSKISDLNTKLKSATATAKGKLSALERVALKKYDILKQKTELYSKKVADKILIQTKALESSLEAVENKISDGLKSFFATDKK